MKQLLVNKPFKTLKLILLVLFIVSSSLLRAQNTLEYFHKKHVIFNNSPIYIEVWNDPYILYGTNAVYIAITNESSDVLQVTVEFSAVSLGGNNKSWIAGPGGNSGSRINPGERLSGEENFCKYDFELNNGNSPFKDNPKVNPIHDMGYHILKIVNISENERKEALQKENKEKQQQELAQKIAQEKQDAINKQAEIEEQKQKAADEAKAKQENTNNSSQNTSTKLSNEQIDWGYGGSSKNQTQQNTSSAGSNTTSNSYATEQQKYTASNNLVQEGNNLQQSGDFAGAQAKYNEALRLNPNNALAIQNNGIAIQNMAEKTRVENHNKALLDAVLQDQVANQVKVEATKKLAGIAFSIYNDYSESRARKKQEEEEQRQAQIASEERAEKKRQLVNHRKDVITNAVAKMPLTAQTHNINEVYFFMYKCDESTLENDFPTFYLSNIFSIEKYADGTWPFMKNVIEKIAKTTKESKYNLVGYFSNRADAEAKLKEYISNCNIYRFTIENVFYNTPQTATNANTSNADFWGNTVKEKTTNKDPETNNKPATDFWGNPIKN
jgi:hypothetical protein